MRTTLPGRTADAFTALELLFVILGLGLIIAFFLPALAYRPPQGNRLRCVNNLKNVGLAFRIFAVDHGDRFPMQVSTNQGGSMELVKSGSPVPHFRLLSNELSNPVLLVCPEDKVRHAATNFALLKQANVSYFVGVEVSEFEPFGLMSGDRHLTTNGRPVLPGLVELTTDSVVGWSPQRHSGTGYLTMADGSVQSVSPARLAECLRSTQMSTNRLAVP